MQPLDLDRADDGPQTSAEMQSWVACTHYMRDCAAQTKRAEEVFTQIKTGIASYSGDGMPKDYEAAIGLLRPVAEMDDEQIRSVFPESPEAFVLPKSAQSAATRQAPVCRPVPQSASETHLRTLAARAPRSN